MAERWGLVMCDGHGRALSEHVQARLLQKHNLKIHNCFIFNQKIMILVAMILKP